VAGMAAARGKSDARMWAAIAGKKGTILYFLKKKLF